MNKSVLSLAVFAFMFVLVGAGCNVITDTSVSTDETSADVNTNAEVESDASTIMEEAVVVNLTGKNFAFSQNEIRVKQGQTVTINFESNGGFHDWVVDDFDAATTQVNSGEPTSVTFVADKAGEFEYYCSVGNHRVQGMVGKLIVEEYEGE